MEHISMTTFLVAGTFVLTNFVTAFLNAEGKSGTLRFLVFYIIHEIIVAGSFLFLGGPGSSIKLVNDFWKGYAEADKRYAKENEALLAWYIFSLLVIVPLAIIQVYSLVSSEPPDDSAPLGSCVSAPLAVVVTAIFMMEILQFLPDLFKGLEKVNSKKIHWPQVVLYHLIFIIIPYNIIKEQCGGGAPVVELEVAEPEEPKSKGKPEKAESSGEDPPPEKAPRASNGGSRSRSRGKKSRGCK